MLRTIFIQKIELLKLLELFIKCMCVSMCRHTGPVENKNMIIYCVHVCVDVSTPLIQWNIEI